MTADNLFLYAGHIFFCVFLMLMFVDIVRNVIDRIVKFPAIPRPIDWRLNSIISFTYSIIATLLIIFF